MLSRGLKIAAILLMAGLAVGAGAQNAAVDVPANARAFEVASVRVAAPGGNGMIMDPQGTQVTERSISMTTLVQLAFGVEVSQISGPAWMNSSEYDVAAKLPDGVSLTYKQMQVPLQQLLADRFKMQFHWEQRERPGYALVVAKSGPKLMKAKEGASKGGNILPDSARFSSATMKAVATMMAIVVKQPVVDKTGIDGDYEIDLKYAPMDGRESTLPSVFTALEETMGLKLVSEKVAVSVLVVDRLEKAPTEN